MPEHWVPIRNVRYTKRFQRSFRKLPESMQQLFRAKEQLFFANPAHPSLRTHRLRGSLKEFHSFSLSLQYRVVFQRMAVDEISLIDVGTHRIYQ